MKVNFENQVGKKPKQQIEKNASVEVSTYVCPSCKKEVEVHIIRGRGIGHTGGECLACQAEGKGIIKKIVDIEDIRSDNEKAKKAEEKKKQEGSK